MEVREVAEPFVDVESVPDEELVRDREPDVADGKVVDKPPVGTIEERRDRERGGPPEGQRLHQVVESQTRVDDVLDDHEPTPADIDIEVLQEADPRVASGRRSGSVPRELDELEVVRDRNGAREIGEEDEAALQRGDEERLCAVVVRRDLTPALVDAGADLLRAEIDLADAAVGG